MPSPATCGKMYQIQWLRLRPLRISRTAILLLLEYKQWQDTQRELLGDAWRDTDGRIFTTEEGKPLFPDTVTNWFTDFVKRTGLPKVTIHSLRHTYASLMIADGTPLVVVSHKLGHAQTSTTANIYAHIDVDSKMEAANMIASKINLGELPEKKKSPKRKIA